MSKYRKKPVVIEAVQYDCIENVDDGAEPMFEGSFCPPDWVIDAIGAKEGEPGSIWIDWSKDDTGTLTLSGRRRRAKLSLGMTIASRFTTWMNQTGLHLWTGFATYWLNGLGSPQKYSWMRPAEI